MPYHKNKQQAFQAVQQALAQAVQATGNIQSHTADEGVHRKRAKQEIEEAERQIEKALTVASEHQHEQLTLYQQQLEELKQRIE
nr:hypothetical protein [Halalkalibacterium ligniniphilum]